MFSAETDIGTVWFKAANLGQAFEGKLLQALGDLRPAEVMSPWAINGECGWWLLPDGRPTLRDTSPTLQTWADLLTQIAVTQRGLADQRSRLTMAPTLATRDSAAYLERLIDGLANRPKGDPQHIGLVDARELTAALDLLAGDADGTHMHSRWPVPTSASGLRLR